MQAKSSSPSSSSASGLSNSGVQLEVMTETSVAAQSGAVEVVTSGQAQLPGVMVSQWSPTGVEKVWYEFIKAVKPEVGLENSKEVCKAMGVMQFSTTRMFQGLHPVQLIQSGPEWGGVTDDVWDIICYLHTASVPEPTSLVVKKVQKEE